MKLVVDLTHSEARDHFLKGSSYFNADLPSYLSFEPILNSVSAVMSKESFSSFQSSLPSNYSGVNYSLISNKDGRLAWRPLELIHPVIYVSLVNLICDADNWRIITNRLKGFAWGAVECCSLPVVSTDQQSDVANQIKSWWQRIEQRSLKYSLDFSRVLHTDVSDCYGSLYTHSVPWAIHGKSVAKSKKSQKGLLGNKIDRHLQAGRYGQTNGIAQGSVLMDFVAELVLGFVDQQITKKLGTLANDVKILRYRDDYRIFTRSDEHGELVLKCISDCLRDVGMRLGVSKTYSAENVVEGSIKSDKLAGIGLQDLGNSNAKTIQKQLLRLHAFGQAYPNSGALRRLVSELHSAIAAQPFSPEDLDVQVAIATDIAYVSPATFPAIAAILSQLISLSPHKTKALLWSQVREKMRRIPYNGYLEIWLQRVTEPSTSGYQFSSDESICQLVNGEDASLWENKWITNRSILEALEPSGIVLAVASDSSEVVSEGEVSLFKTQALNY